MRMAGPLRPARVEPQSTPNVTPLIDVLLVLLIIFMAALPLTQKGLDLSLPPEPQPQPEPLPQGPSPHIVLEYSAERQVTINHEPVPLVDVESRLRVMFAARRDKTLFVDGAPSLRYGDIVAVVDAAKGAGVQRVGIITPDMKAAAQRR